MATCRSWNKPPLQIVLLDLEQGSHLDLARWRKNRVRRHRRQAETLRQNRRISAGFQPAYRPWLAGMCSATVVWRRLPELRTWAASLKTTAYLWETVSMGKLTLRGSNGKIQFGFFILLSLVAFLLQSIQGIAGQTASHTCSISSPTGDTFPCGSKQFSYGKDSGSFTFKGTCVGIDQREGDTVSVYGFEGCQITGKSVEAKDLHCKTTQSEGAYVSCDCNSQHHSVPYDVYTGGFTCKLD